MQEFVGSNPSDAIIIPCNNTLFTCLEVSCMNFLGPYGALANYEIDVLQIKLLRYYLFLFQLTHPLIFFCFLKVDAKHVKSSAKTIDEPKCFEFITQSNKCECSINLVF